MNDVPTCLHLTYDQTTAQGSGGDPIQARDRSQSFNAAYSIVHSGMKDLMDINETQACLLLYFHVDLPEFIEERYRMEIIKEMQKYFWQQVDSKGMHASTIEKIPRLCDIVLRYSKAYITGAPQDRKTAIASYLGIEQNQWYDSSNRAKWNQWFELLVTYLRDTENQAQTHMHPYCEQVGAEIKRIRIIATKIRKMAFA